jgi:hypothetical protein
VQLEGLGKLKNCNYSKHKSSYFKINKYEYEKDNTSRLVEKTKNSRVKRNQNSGTSGT